MWTTLARGLEIISNAHVSDRDITAAIEDLQGTAHMGQPTDREPVPGNDEGLQSYSHVSPILLQPDAPNDALTPEDDARILLDAALTSFEA